MRRSSLASSRRRTASFLVFSLNWATSAEAWLTEFREDAVEVAHRRELDDDLPAGRHLRTRRRDPHHLQGGTLPLSGTGRIRKVQGEQEQA